MKKLLFFVIVTVVTITNACKKIETTSSEVTSSSITRLIGNDANGIPFADSATLSQFVSDKQIINYIVARKMALIQLGTANNRNDMNWTGYTISEKPVLVYGFDSRPKYYEFIMYDAEHKPAGTCITHAKKSAPSVVSDLITGVRNYASIAAKGNGGNLQFFAGAGNNLYIGIPAKDGGDPIGVTDPSTGNTISGGTELTDEQQVQMLSQANQNQHDSLQSILSTTSDPTAQAVIQQSIDSTNPVTVNNSLQTGLSQYHAARDTFWNGVAQIQDSLLTISDSTIAGSTKGFFDWISDWFTSIFHGPQTSSQMINKYLNASSNQTCRNSTTNPNNSGWCGPSAMAWMYYVHTGDDKKYDYFLSNAGKYNDGVIAYFVWLWNIVFPGRPMSPSDMFFSMGNITNWQVVIAPWLSINLNGGGVYQNIQYSHQSSILLSLDAKEPHWSVVYGCDRTTYWYGWSDYYFYIWDNGAITGYNTTNNGTGVYKHKRIASYPVASVPVLWD